MKNKIIIATHGTLARGFLDVVSMISGEPEDVAAIGVMPGDEPEEFKARLTQETEEGEKAGKGVLVFLDVLCGTPFNIVIEQLKKPGFEIIAGANLPMILEAVLHQDEPLEDLCSYAARMGRAGIHTKKELLDEMEAATE